ncbi:hypothetical protein OKA04_11920 [Luteolibacter flavescens]|uniref:Uncharacterized protein n=1 Tax=Luteolibacter flavescens TaxID=1859460 RepID=A0ABT3FPF7_9BACT|nr:DUF6607 family protein [Luteolibacter flavescens]MCW1885438.1 hypothetical protein [Luteolibacter flavescens]
MKRPTFLLSLAACAGLQTTLPAEEAKPAPAAPAPAKEEAKPEAEAKPETKAKAESAGGHIFAWPFMEWEKMKPRGGTTQGSEVTLFEGAKDSWKKLHEPGLAKQEQDRRAILAMAGNYRVSFDFTETLGLAENFKPTRPYFSWGTENVTVIEDSADFVSLQHSLVMYFKDEKGETSGPHVMKHWRQDWTWEDPELQVYQGDMTWKKQWTPDRKGRWSQAVFQVDDSPRYEVAGTWTHDGGLSTWRSDDCPRPLPRREHTIRKDYNVLSGIHEISITPNGWVHIQNNAKVQVDKDGTRRTVGKEIGVDRYEEITAPELAPAFNDYWTKTNGYWKDVRDTWATILKEKETFSMKDTYDGKQLFMIHFGHAAKLEKGEDAGDNLKHAQETIGHFLNP